MNRLPAPRTLAMAALASVLGLAVPAEAHEPTRENCMLMVLRNGDVAVAGPVQVMTVSGPLSAPPAGGENRAVLCQRDTIIPARGDERVLTQLGLPLVIVAADDRMFTLEMVDGRIQTRFLKGDVLAGEGAELQARLDELQRAADGRP